MNRNNGILTTETQRGGTPHPVRCATVVETLRAASLQAAIASRRDAMLVANNATPLQLHPEGMQPRYLLPVTCYPLHTFSDFPRQGKWLCSIFQTSPR